MGEETKPGLHDTTAMNRGLENPPNSPPKHPYKFLWLCIFVSAGFEIVVNAHFDSMISSGQDEMRCYLTFLIHHLVASLGILGHIYKLRTRAYDQEIKALERLLGEKEAKSQQDVKNAAKEYEGEQERLHEKMSMLDWFWSLNYTINTTNLLILTKDWNSKINRALKRTRSKVSGRANKDLVTHVIDLIKTHRKRILFKILLSEKVFAILED
ncbi:hypothetical protein BS50DRAFT_628633 [Corynespora cassiicola Philippines]|uniref:Uncharacterized protein n=1 Tax=Corynespora cassiicola Philippines TaxID=1448308 RepID=A0A2T2PDN0_CORCC|nr:hypothetical protein BS50DRAFT_628633 [Corynespora cassiicola Philippines]